VEEAQRLLNLALDISSATGKPLEAVANALGKAYDGNLTSLSKLGLGLDQSILKSKDFDLVFQSLTGTFGGFAENEAQSTEKAFARIKIASDEVQEQIGTALLPLVQELTTYILTDVVPVIQQFVNGLTGVGGLDESLTDSETSALEWGKRIRSLIGTVVEFKDELIAVAAVIGTVFVVSKISAAVTATIALIKTLIAAYNALKVSAIVTGVATAFALNPLLGVGAVALAAGVLSAANALANSSKGETNFAVGGAPSAISGGGASSSGSGGTGGGTTSGGGGGGGGVTAAVASAVAATKAVAGGGFTDSQNAARLIAQGGGGFTDSQNAARLAAQTPQINITVNGAIDKEGTARTIVETLNNSYYRGTGGASALQAI
jgi:hypothetical protein